MGPRFGVGLGALTYSSRTCNIYLGPYDLKGANVTRMA